MSRSGVIRRRLRLITEVTVSVFSVSSVPRVLVPVFLVMHNERFQQLETLLSNSSLR